MLRHGAGSAVDRIKRLYANELAASEEARSALDYLDRRRENIRYGWLREHGYYISSAHAEAAARILVAQARTPTPADRATSMKSPRLPYDARIITRSAAMPKCARS